MFLFLVCGQLKKGIAALFTGRLTPALEFVSSLTRQLHIPLFLSSSDPQTKVEYYIINVYPHYTATSQAFSDLIKFQQWHEVAIITERAESKRKRKFRVDQLECSSCRSTLFTRSIEINFG